MIACVVVVAIAAPGLYLSQVTITTHFVVEVFNATGEWPLSETAYTFDVQPCATYHGWWSSPTACTFHLSNPMDRSQNVSLIILYVGWKALIIQAPTSWTGSNVTVQSGNRAAVFGPYGALTITYQFETPAWGGDYTNTLMVQLDVLGNVTTR